MKYVKGFLAFFFIIAALFGTTYIGVQRHGRSLTLDSLVTELNIKVPYMINHYKTVNGINEALIINLSEHKDWCLLSTVTTYWPVANQTDDSPFHTATGDTITEESYYKWCGVSPDILGRYVNYGDSVFIMFYGEAFGNYDTYVDTAWSGWYIVKDCTNARLSNTFDIIIPERDKHRGFSVKAVVTNYYNEEIEYEP